MWTRETGSRVSGVSSIGASPLLGERRIVWSKMMTLDAPVAFLINLRCESAIVKSSQELDSRDSFVVVLSSDSRIVVEVLLRHSRLRHLLGKYLESRDVDVGFASATGID